MSAATQNTNGSMYAWVVGKTVIHRPNCMHVVTANKTPVLSVGSSVPIVPSPCKLCGGFVHVDPEVTYRALLELMSELPVHRPEDKFLQQESILELYNLACERRELTTTKFSAEVCRRLRSSYQFVDTGRKIHSPTCPTIYPQNRTALQRPITSASSLPTTERCSVCTGYRLRNMPADESASLTLSGLVTLLAAMTFLPSANAQGALPLSTPPVASSIPEFTLDHVFSFPCYASSEYRDFKSCVRVLNSLDPGDTYGALKSCHQWDMDRESGFPVREAHHSDAGKDDPMAPLKGVAATVGEIFSRNLDRFMGILFLLTVFTLLTALKTLTPIVPLCATLTYAYTAGDVANVALNLGGVVAHLYKGNVTAVVAPAFIVLLSAVLGYAVSRTGASASVALSVGCFITSSFVTVLNEDFALAISLAGLSLLSLVLEAWRPPLSTYNPLKWGLLDALSIVSYTRIGLLASLFFVMDRMACWILCSLIMGHMCEGAFDQTLAFLNVLFARLGSLATAIAKFFSSAVSSGKESLCRVVCESAWDPEEQGGELPPLPRVPSRSVTIKCPLCESPLTKGHSCQKSCATMDEGKMTEKRLRDIERNFARNRSRLLSAGMSNSSIASYEAALRLFIGTVVSLCEGQGVPEPTRRMISKGEYFMDSCRHRGPLLNKENKKKNKKVRPSTFYNKAEADAVLEKLQKRILHPAQLSEDEKAQIQHFYGHDYQDIYAHNSHDDEEYQEFREKCAQRAADRREDEREAIQDLYDSKYGMLCDLDGMDLGRDDERRGGRFDHDEEYMDLMYQHKCAQEDLDLAETNARYGEGAADDREVRLLRGVVNMLSRKLGRESRSSRVLYYTPTPVNAKETLAESDPQDDETLAILSAIDKAADYVETRGGDRSTFMDITALAMLNGASVPYVPLQAYRAIRITPNARVPSIFREFFSYTSYHEGKIRTAKPTTWSDIMIITKLARIDQDSAMATPPPQLRPVTDIGQALQRRADELATLNVPVVRAENGGLYSLQDDVVSTLLGPEGFPIASSSTAQGLEPSSGSFPPYGVPGDVTARPVAESAQRKKKEPRRAAKEGLTFSRPSTTSFVVQVSQTFLRGQELQEVTAHGYIKGWTDSPEGTCKIPCVVFCQHDDLNAPVQKITLRLTQELSTVLGVPQTLERSSDDIPNFAVTDFTYLDTPQAIPTKISESKLLHFPIQTTASMREVTKHVAPAKLLKEFGEGSSVCTITLNTSNPQAHSVVVSSGVVHMKEQGRILHTASTTYNNTASGSGSSGCPVLVNGALYGAHNSVQGSYNVAWYVPHVATPRPTTLKFKPSAERQSKTVFSSASLGRQYFCPSPHVFPQKGVNPVPNPNAELRGSGTRLWSKASPEQLLMEVQTAIIGEAGWDRELVFRQAMAIFKEAGPHSLIPFEDVVSRKANARSNSYPFSKHASLYRDLKTLLGDAPDDISSKEIVSLLKEYKRVCETEVMQSVYYAAPKADFHTLKKIQSGRMRALYMQPLLDFLLSVHLFGNLDYMVKMRRDMYCPNLGRKDTILRKRPLRGLHTFGLDFTAWDKSITVDLIVPILEAMCAYAGIDPDSPLGQWVMNTNAFPVIIVPSSEGPHHTIQANGGNPSGGHLTTLIGCVAHEIVFRLAPGSLHMKTLICSDDSVYGSSDPAYAAGFANDYREYLLNHRILPKFDFLEGSRLFPPGVFPPFLSKVEDWRFRGLTGDMHVLVPANPSRAVVGLSVFPANFETSQTDRDLYSSRLRGVYNEIYPSLITGAAHPKIYDAVVKEMERLGVPVKYPSSLRNTLFQGA